MKTVTGKIVSSTSVPIARAASILSNFVSAETGASQAVNAYLRRANLAFDELVRLHSKYDRRKHRKDKLNAGDDAPTTEEVPTRSMEVSQGELTPKKKKKKKKNRVDVDDGNVVNEVKEDRSEGGGNLEEETWTRKHKKEKKVKKSYLQNLGDEEGKMIHEIKEMESHGEGNLEEETDGKKQKKKTKKKERNHGGNSEENGVEIGEGKIIIEELKEEKKKRKSTEVVEEESKDGSEELQNKKKKKKRRRRRTIGEGDNN